MTAQIGSFTPDRLIMNCLCHTDNTIITSGQNLKRGAVLGKIKYAVPTTGTLAGTGNGTVTLVKPRSKTKQGTYTITCSSLLATAAIFSVSNPDGISLGNVTVGLGTADYADFDSTEIAFRITNQSTDFDATSVFTIAVTSYVPVSGTISGTGNGTQAQVEPRRASKSGAYVATCSVLRNANVLGATFTVKDPDGNALPNAYSSFKHNAAGAITGTGAVTEIKAGPLFKNTGAYLIHCTAAATNGGTFSVTDPDGVVIGTFSLPGTSTGAATFWHEQISFKLTDATDFILDDEIVLYWYETPQIAFVLWTGATAWAVNDTGTTTFAIGGRESTLVNSDNVNGSQDPWAILAEDVDATNAAVSAAVYTGGTFNERSLYFGGNDTIEDHRSAMRILCMYTKTSFQAGNEP